MSDENQTPVPNTSIADDSLFKHEWSFGQTLELIEDYKKYANLWFMHHPDYRNRKKRVQALSELSAKFGVTKHEIERKLKNLSCHYFREKKKMLGNTNFRPDSYISNWYAFNSLDFLYNKRLENESDDSDDEVLEGQNKLVEIEVKLEPKSQHTQPTTSRRSNTAYKPRDEYAIFGELVALKLRRIANPVTRYTIQHKIQTLLWEASCGKHDQPVANAKPNTKAITNAAKSKVAASPAKKVAKRIMVRKNLGYSTPDLSSIIANQPVVFITPIRNPLSPTPITINNPIKTESTSPRNTPSPPLAYLPSPSPQSSSPILDQKQPLEPSNGDPSLVMDIDNEYFINNIKNENE